jgi:hypothetical protein
MKMRFLLVFLLYFFVVTAAYSQQTSNKTEGVVTRGQMGTPENDQLTGRIK